MEFNAYVNLKADVSFTPFSIPSVLVLSWHFITLSAYAYFSFLLLPGTHSLTLLAAANCCINGSSSSFFLPPLLLFLCHINWLPIKGNRRFPADVPILVAVYPPCQIDEECIGTSNCTRTHSLLLTHYYISLSVLRSLLSLNPQRKRLCGKPWE